MGELLCYAPATTDTGASPPQTRLCGWAAGTGRPTGNPRKPYTRRAGSLAFAASGH